MKNIYYWLRRPDYPRSIRGRNNRLPCRQSVSEEPPPDPFVSPKRGRLIRVLSRPIRRRVRVRRRQRAPKKREQIFCYNCLVNRSINKYNLFVPNSTHNFWFGHDGNFCRSKITVRRDVTVVFFPRRNSIAKSFRVVNVKNVTQTTDTLKSSPVNY